MHDFHNKDRAGGRLGGVSIPMLDNKVKTKWDKHPFNLFNKNLIYDKTEGVKMTE
jgi:hypothetical protein